MSAVTVELPSELEKKLKAIAERTGLSVDEILVEAAEKMSEIEILEQIKRDAKQRGTREAFEKVLAAVPDVEPENPDDRIK